MKNFLKENLVLVLAFLIPLVFIVVVALVVYLPSKYIYSNYEFVYVSCPLSNYNHRSCLDIVKYKYYVEKGKMVVSENVDIISSTTNNVIPQYDKEGKIDYKPEFFIYNTKTQENRQIDIEELKNLVFEDGVVSPDGFSVVRDYNSGMEVFPFYYNSSSYGLFLKKGKTKRELDLPDNDDYYYRDNFLLLGWVSLEGKQS